MMKSSWRSQPLYSIFIASLILFSVWISLREVRKIISTEIHLQHAQIEAELSQRLGQPVKIESIQMRWTGLTPTILLKHIQIFDQKTKKPSLNIGYLNLTPAMIESVRRWKLIPAQLSLENVALTVKQLSDFQWKIPELNYTFGANAQSSFSLQSLIRLISLPNVELKKISLHIIPIKQSLAMHIKLQHIQFGIDSLWQNLYLYGEGLSLNLPGEKNTLPALSLSLQLQAIADQNHIQQLLVSKFNLMNADFHWNADGKIDVGHSLSESIMNLRGRFSFFDLKHFPQYVPSTLVDPELSNWFQQAFLEGAISQGELEWKGPLSAFPYDHEDGLFKLIIPVHQVNLKFAPEWPSMKIDKAQVTLLGRALYINVDSAQLNQIPVHGIQAWIPYLGDAKPQILELKIPEGIQTTLTDAINYIRLSPLENKIGKYFEGALTSGPIYLGLSLTVPLKHPNLLSVLGEIQFKQNHFAYPKFNLALDQLVGGIRFTEKMITSQNMRGLYFKEPASLVIEHDPKNSKFTHIQLNSIISVSNIEKIIHQPLQSYLIGKMPFSALVSFSEQDPLKILINSNLEGLQVKLKNFLDKSAALKQEVRIVIQGLSKSEWLTQIQYADLFGFSLKVKQKNSEWETNGMLLQLGKGSPAMPSGKGLSIAGVLPELNLSEMNTLFSNSSGTSIKLEKINVLIQKLKWGAQSFLNTRILAEPNTDYWNIRLEGADLAGSLQIPNRIFERSNASLITAKLSRLNLKTANTNTVETLKFNQVPNVNLNIQAFKLDQRLLGEIALSLSSEKDKLRITQLQVKTKSMLLSSEGKWDAQGTRLLGKLSSTNINQVLLDLKFPITTFDAKQGDLDFDLSWKNSPINLKWFNANGELNLEINDGRIIPESTSTGAKMDFGKLLNLLSLQSLPKRLTLDFSDVFQKGYHFDRLSGSFRLSNGIARINHLNFKGALANIKIQGDIGLFKKTYRLLVSVMPQVTSSIPVAATLVTGQPLIGLGAWVANKVLSKPVSQVAGSHYWVSGEWENPKWQSISETQAKEMLK